MKLLNLTILLLFANLVYGHEPEISSFMIYEQNGKTFLVIKSSLTAFEGEVDYHFTKNAYKSADEFKQLVITHFKQNCFILINNDSAKFTNPYIVLGHETTLFAELLNKPKMISYIKLRNTFFKDMRNNMCELVLTIKGLPQKLYILNNDNKQEVKLSVENEKWVVEGSSPSFYKSSNMVIWGILICSSFSIIIIAYKWEKNGS